MNDRSSHRCAFSAIGMQNFESVTVKDGDDRANEVCGEDWPTWCKQTKTYMSWAAWISSVPRHIRPGVWN
ncbi:MAG: hypothetical protein ACREJN_13180, partial [Nitrospiraceae bacterium]